MQIRVKCGCDRADCSDWALLELQGVLEIQPSAKHLPLHSLTLGSLCSPTQDDYFFTIGYHQLQGKKVALKKPLLVLQKKRQQQDEASIDLDDDSGTQYPKQTPQKVELHVIGVIRHKLLFKTRPKALIST